MCNQKAMFFLKNGFPQIQTLENIMYRCVQVSQEVAQGVVVGQAVQALPQKLEPWEGSQGGFLALPLPLGQVEEAQASEYIKQC